MKLLRFSLLGVVIALSALVGLHWTDLVSKAAYAVEAGKATAAREQLRHAQDLSAAFQEVVKSVRPSVVSIRSTTRVAAAPGPRIQPPLPRGPLPGPFGDDFIERFFGEQMPRDFVQRGLGTGVIVSADGHIVTNNHVVGQANEIRVTLSDDRTFDARVIGRDEKTDLAVLKIEASGLLPAQLGDSDAINVGEWVLAIGSPFGLSYTVTAGIVSAKGRANVGITDYEDFIQTDAAINPGNSGGPLVNLNGEVVGINTAIFSRSGGYQGIGFAIPAAMVRQVMDSIIRDGKVVRGWLGVVIQELNEGLAQSFAYNGTNGALIGDVSPGGPAARAGIEAGDIVTKFDGREITGINQFRNLVAATAPGRRVPVEVFRDGQLKELTVEVGELRGDQMLAGGGAPAGDLGLTVAPLTPARAQELGISAGVEGVVVTGIEPGGLAESAGVQSGDVIVSVGGEQVTTPGEFNAALARHDLAQGVRLSLLSEGTRRFVWLQRQ
jgi:serine protease Do